MGADNDNQPGPRPEEEAAMTPERWASIQEVFEQALDRRADARAALLDEACAGDPALRREVESLLDAFEGVGPFDVLAGELAAPLAAVLQGASAEGRRAGPYRVLHEIGRGGMGTVYLAERADGAFEQQVALKLVRYRTAGKGLLIRFLNERQILARLRHPNIARLLDGGVTEPAPGEPGGQPYFAMEYVEGRPLDTYCDAHRLSITERLELFVKVGGAVQYAHQNLVVHRDLKPSNLLVTEAGDVRLLDFGIAKLLEDTDEAPGVTRTGMRVMTPEYASPEQVRGEDVTTASDVFQLGVVLYELLTGRRPHRFEALTPGEVERVICEEDPAKPSTAVSRVEEIPGAAHEMKTITPEQVGRARATQAERLRRQLSGDLDTIVLKALQKEPSRRYASAEAFVEDVRRHLAGLPVAARPDTLGYRTRKFVHRHRIGVAAAAFVALSLLGGLAIAVWQARVAATERDRAQQQAAKAEQVSAFLVDVFGVSDPSEARGDTITAREVLDQGATQIEKLTDQPEVQAEMMAVMGQVYQNLGLYEDAGRLLEEALALRREIYGVEHEKVAESLHHLGVLRYRQGAYDPAERLLREALALQRKLLESPHLDLAATQYRLAELLSDRGRYEEAEWLFREALATRRELLEETDPVVRAGLDGLALLLHRKGDFEAAETLFREAVANSRRTSVEVHPTTVASLRDLARLLHHFRRDFEEAAPLYQEALAMSRTLYGENHPEVATSLNDLAQLRRDEGNYRQAESFARASVAIWEKLYGTAHLEVAVSKQTLATILWARHDYEEAEALHREALSVKRQLLGDEHLAVIVGLLHLAGVLSDKDERAAAESLYTEALATSRKLFDERHGLVARSLQGLARLHSAAGDHAAAEPLYRRALRIREQLHGADHWRLAQARSALAGCLTALRHYEEAEALLLKSYSVLKAQRGARRNTARTALQRLTALYEAWGKPAQADAYRLLLAEEHSFVAGG